MKKLFLLALSVNALCGYPEDGVPKKEKKAHEQTEKIDLQEVFDTAQKMGTSTYNFVRNRFYTQDGGVNYDNVKLAAALGTGIVLGIRFSSIGRLAKLIEEHHKSTVSTIRTSQETMGQQFQALSGKIDALGIRAASRRDRDERY